MTDKKNENPILTRDGTLGIEKKGATNTKHDILVNIKIKYSISSMENE